MKRASFLFLSLIFCLQSFYTQAQENEGAITGKVVNRKDRQPIAGAILRLEQPAKTVKTATDGSFVMRGLPYGVYKLIIEATDFMPTEYNLRINTAKLDLSFITLSEEFIIEDIDEAAFSELESDESSDDQSMPAMLASYRDVFDQMAAFNLSTLRFRSRGYENSSQEIYVNGIYMNDALSGYGSWSLWGGLNDAMRNQETADRLNAFEYGVGGFNGTTNLNMRASHMRKGFRVSAVTANAMYRYRLMASYASGNLDNGWSYAFNFSTRQGGNDFVKGADYNAWAYFGSVDKKINDAHRLSLTVFGSPTQRGAQMAATQEVYDLIGTNFYNPNWGFQNGKVRNARVRTYHEPVAILNYFFTPDDKSSLTVSAAYRFGKNGYSSLDWYDAADPKPDYHRNLPSYYAHRNEPSKAFQIAEDWRNNSGNMAQLNWDKLYRINQHSDFDWQWQDKEGNVVKDFGSGRSKYIVSERHTDQKDLHFNINYSRIIGSHIKLYSGIDLRSNRTEHYNQVTDLLGGEYWLNVDNFAERDFSNVNFEVLMNDMGNKDNIVAKEGEKYGYHYFTNLRDAKLWTNLNFSKGSFEGFAAVSLGFNQIWRNGVYKKGLFPDQSQGESKKKNFITYKFKAGLTYRIAGNQHLTLSGVAMANAPQIRDAFVSPRTRNDIVNNLMTEKVVGGDLTYVARLPWLTLRASGFYTVIQDRTKLVGFYDDLNNTFSNFAMSEIDQSFMGTELGFEIPITVGLKLKGAASFGDYKYTSNPLFTQTRDNNAEVILQDEKVYWKNFKVEGTPHFASSLGLAYRTDSYWFYEINAVYASDMYLSMSPLYRTVYAIEGAVTKDQVHSIVGQERLKPAFIMNASIGKTLYISRKYNVGFNLQAKNILNSTDIKTGGFEQSRLRTIEGQNYKRRYDSKYFYLYGASYYLNVYLRF